IRRELTEPETYGTKPALEPQFRQTYGWRGLNRRDRVHAADVVAPNPAIITNSEGVGVKCPILPASQFFKVDVELPFQLVLKDRAAPDAARQIAQHIACIDQTVSNAVFVQTLPVSKWVAVLRQARRDRRLSDAKITRLVLSPRGHAASGGQKR